VAELERDPAHPLPPGRGRHRDVILGAGDQSNLGDRIAAIGPWQRVVAFGAVSILTTVVLQLRGG
jgi:hypothetical protein